MHITAKFPMKINEVDPVTKEFYNSSLIEAYQDYAENIGGLFTYNPNREPDYKYQVEDIVGALSKTCYLSVDNELITMVEITNDKYKYLNSIGCLFFYVWPYITATKCHNGLIQISKITSIELLV